MSVSAEAAEPHIGSLDPITFTTAIAALKENEAYLIRWKSAGDAYPPQLRILYAIGACPRNEKWLDTFIQLHDMGRFISFEHLTYSPSMHGTHECAICRKPHGLGPNAKYNL